MSQEFQFQPEATDKSQIRRRLMILFTFLVVGGGLILAISLLLRDQKAPYIGKWEPDSSNWGASTTPFGSSDYLEIREDGSFLARVEGTDYRGSYEDLDKEEDGFQFFSVSTPSFPSVFASIKTGKDGDSLIVRPHQTLPLRSSNGSFEIKFKRQSGWKSLF